MKHVSSTPRKRVLAYAKRHGLRVCGDQLGADITIMDGDRMAHWSEAWSLRGLETYAEAERALLRIEQAWTDNGMRRPWEVARRHYTGCMQSMSA